MHVNIKYVGVYVLMHTCHSQISQGGINQLRFPLFFLMSFTKNGLKNKKPKKPKKPTKQQSPKNTGFSFLQMFGPVLSKVNNENLDKKFCQLEYLQYDTIVRTKSFYICVEIA